jgi:hypothetical protein
MINEPTHALTCVHDVFILEACIHWLATIYLQRKFIVIIYLQVTNAFATLMEKNFTYD